MSEIPVMSIGEMSPSTCTVRGTAGAPEADGRDRLDVVTAGASAAAAPPAAYRCAKAVIDRGTALLLVVLGAPIWLTVALAVRLTSRGPVLFRQARVGRNGRQFTVFKFRTMCVDAHARLVELGLYETYVATGYKLQVHEECRVTPVGRFLRRTSLDELPQLLNVVRGDMSLVGPRPVVPEELACYGDLVHCYVGVRPGITGLWQVSGRSHVRFPERATIDRRYYEQRSLRLDLAILLRTPVAVLRGEGAF